MQTEMKPRLVSILKGGKSEGNVDLSHSPPGEEFIYLERYPYLWQGEETLDYTEKGGFLYVNGKVRGVDLDKVQLGDIPDPNEIVMAISSGKHMQNLSIFSNLLALTTNETQDKDMVHLVNLHSLRNLDLGTHAGVTDEGLSNLSGLRDLRMLNLLKTSVTDAGLLHLRGLLRLSVLWLADTKITGEGLKHLTGLTNLRTLGLSGTAVKDKDLMHLKPLSNLEFLSIKSTQVTETGIKGLQKALPECRIHASLQV